MRSLTRVGAMLLVASATIMIACSGLGRYKETHRDGSISSGDVFHLSHLITPHYAEDHYVTVGKRTFTHARGLSPYYLKLPEINSILFVTERQNKVTFHIVNLSTLHMVKISDSEITFGSGIGVHRPEGSMDREYVECISSNKLIAVTLHPDARKSYHLSLYPSKIEKIDYVKLETNKMSVPQAGPAK